MVDDTVPCFGFPAVGRKKVTAAFDGGRLTSDGGVMLLSLAERRLGIAERLARLIPDRRDPTRITHSFADMIRARLFAICCGYEDADDLDTLRTDPAFKLACGRLPDSGVDLCSQPTLSRLENAPRLRDVIRLTYALVDAWMDSYPREPEAVTLDIDDTCDVVHGHQQLSLFNAHYDERCFLPIHVYDTERSRPVAVVLRPGKTPSGVEVRAHVRRLVRHIRARWPKTRILLRGDGHYARPEAMAWCEANGLQYVFGLPGSKPLSRKVEDDRRRGAHRARRRRQARRARLRRNPAQGRLLEPGAPGRGAHRGDPPGPRYPLRRHQRRAGLARVDLRQPLLRPRAGREPDQAAQVPAPVRPHLVPIRAGQPGPPRAAHRRVLADAGREGRHPEGPRPGPAEFTTLRFRLLKVAARIVETRHRVRIAFAAACPEADVIAGLSAALLRRRI